MSYSTRQETAPAEMTDTFSGVLGLMPITTVGYFPSVLALRQLPVPLGLRWSSVSAQWNTGCRRWTASPPA
ncbi:hypothetical protein FHS26_003677 [Rhizobium pisi]|uniref:Uncharacterized protein n=1 Tax=Rhizobium pisi TaxID=574561 RepID=A0A7W5BMW0_9HYPH|nr:hypothetical protein [Rhizobium pisi]